MADISRFCRWKAEFVKNESIHAFLYLNRSSNETGAPSIYTIYDKFNVFIFVAIYRLDRLTSGVFIFCKTEYKTKELMAHVRDRNMNKQYVCKVQGQFPRLVLLCSSVMSLCQTPVVCASHTFKNNEDRKSIFSVTFHDIPAL